MNPASARKALHRGWETARLPRSTRPDPDPRRRFAISRCSSVTSMPPKASATCVAGFSANAFAIPASAATMRLGGTMSFCAIR